MLLKVLQIVQIKFSSEWGSIVSNCTRAIQYNFYKDELINSVVIPEEAIKFVNQLKLFPSKPGSDLKKKTICNNDSASDAIPEDLKSISKRSQVIVEINTEGSSELGQKRTIINNRLQVGTGLNKMFEEAVKWKKLLTMIS